MGPVETLRYGLPKDSSDWNEVTFVSEKQVIEELATGTLTEKGLGTKFIANLTRLMSRAFGKKKALATTPKRKLSGVKDELRSLGAPGEELEGEFEGFIPEGKFISAYNHVRSHVRGFAERLNNLWKNSTDLVSRSFIPRKSPMIFRWHSNNAWNPREWITKRLNLRQKTNFWNDDDLLTKVYEVAGSHIESRRHGNPAAKHLQGEINYLFDEKVSGEKESHILAWNLKITPHGVYHPCSLRRRCHQSSTLFIIFQMIWAVF